MKKTALGSAALGAGPVLFLPKQTDPVKDGPVFHPHLHPLGVVGIHDPGMTTESNPTSPWRVQDKLVEAKAVDRNIDRLALALTKEKEPGEAWKKIFFKPAAKAWNETTARHIR